MTPGRVDLGIVAEGPLVEVGRGMAAGDGIADHGGRSLPTADRSRWSRFHLHFRTATIGSGQQSADRN
jgi:hypothetical protein